MPVRISRLVLPTSFVASLYLSFDVNYVILGLKMSLLSLQREIALDISLILNAIQSRLHFDFHIKQLRLIIFCEISKLI